MRNTGPIAIRRLHPLFGAEVTGIDITRPLSAREFGPLRAAFEEHSVLVLRDQPMDDEKQIAFSENFGPLEPTLSANPAVGTVFARQSNLDINTGETIPSDDMRMIYQKANYFWHSDSSFKPVPSLCSILTARLCPPEGGDTEFCSMRAAWNALPAALQATVEPLVAEHALVYSRNRVQPGILSAKALSDYPPVRQRMVRDNPLNGRRALYIGAHCGHIVGWPRGTSDALLEELTLRGTRPEFTFAHKWREGDVVIWDNRAVLHRATAYDTVKHKRLMQRTTVAGDAPTVPQ
ncbi:MAG: TauD/TfdA family dioxygenase [Alphaproteobacteria bacterium]|nr:TauD/TfdA family dioxygenase [Alphaproteobacteria bacterium]